MVFWLTDVFLQRVSLKEQVYIADNLAFFNYQTQDEPLFIIHHIDVIVSVTGSNLLQSFREVIILNSFIRLLNKQPLYEKYITHTIDTSYIWVVVVKS